MSDTWPCPECGTPVEYETVDIGVGSQQCTPAECPKCGWFQGYPEDPDKEARWSEDV